MTILRDLAEDKLPALEQADSPSAGTAEPSLYSRSRYTDGLRRQAQTQPQLHLVSIEDVIAARAARSDS